VQLADVPLLFALVGLAAYVVLGGADFGAGFWQLVAWRGRRSRELREHALHAIGPVWEANHVWLIFVLVVCSTAYPRAFGSIASTLAAPLFIAGIGIVLRGTAYALRAAEASARTRRAIESVFATSSVLTPFALGAAVGGIASGRVPVGNAAGHLLASWLNPTSAFIGMLTVASCAYLAAVYLTADARRMGRADLAAAFRLRALAAGAAAGALALGGLVVVRFDARPIWDGLTHGAGLACVLVSAAAGLTTLAAMWRSRPLELARATAALAVAAIVFGWALAQRPWFLPGLTVEQAAAGRSTLTAVVIGIAVGAALLAPSLTVLFGLVLRGRFDPAAPPAAPPVRRGRTNRATWERPLTVCAFVCLLAGGALTLLADGGVALALGLLALAGFAVSAFALLAGREPEDGGPGS
jgi:cytochrome d ubiquinol oxidase subunit II